MPVLLDEVVAAFGPRDDGLYLDGTFGVGGYSQALLEAPRCRVVAHRPRSRRGARAASDMAQLYAGRLTVIEGRFGDMERLLAPLGITQLHGVALDLGVSSAQLDDAERGFSFRSDGPLDMRMGGDGRSAADLVNTLPESALADLIFRLRRGALSRGASPAPSSPRGQGTAHPHRRAGQLLRRRADTGGIDPSTRTFQALRIAVNDELDELDRGLAAAERLLAPGGRLAVVAFHSLEDRRVKDFLRAPQRRRTASEPPSSGRPGPAPSFQLLTRKPRLAERRGARAQSRAPARPGCAPPSAPPRRHGRSHA